MASEACWSSWKYTVEMASVVQTKPSLSGIQSSFGTKWRLKFNLCSLNTLFAIVLAVSWKTLDSLTNRISGL